MKKKAPVLQAALFSVDNPPVKLALTPMPPQPEAATIPPEVLLFAQETAFYIRLYDHLGKMPNTTFTCLYCGKEYRCLTFHLLRVCKGQWEPKEEPIPLPQEDTQRPEPSENMPGEYAYKKKGMEKAEVMHPSYRPKPDEKAPEGPPRL